ncbi:Uncharacterised protein [Candidatus Anstonella stagnisolia]|nr:Uncharacterised protein [Candidatus Anstonella stagnisolia]
MDTILPLSFAFFISLAAYVADRLEKKVENYYSRILSFNAGMLIGVLILTLLPIALEGDFLSSVLFAAGFCLFFLVEEYAYHNMRPKQIKHTVGKLHLIGFFLISFMFGMLLLFGFDVSFKAWLFLLFPIALRTTTASLYGAHIMRKINLIPFQHELAAFSLFAGALFAAWLGTNSAAYFVSFFCGCLLFTTARDVIRPSKKDDIALFLFGIALTFACFYLLSN